MSEQFQHEAFLLDRANPPHAMNKKPNNCYGINHETSHEVFRNDTTAVDVIIKQVKNQSKKINKQNPNVGEIDERFSEDIDNLKIELNTTKKNLEETKKYFRVIMFEMKKQLEAANERELKTQTRNLLLQLEKEKLKVILESKTNIVKKLRKELLSVKRIAKVVIKGMRCIPNICESLKVDSEYEEFENYLKNDLPRSIETTFDRRVDIQETTVFSKV